MTKTKTQFTYQDYLALPETVNRLELIDGQLVREPSPGFRHQQIVGNLFDCFRQFVRRRRLGIVLMAPLDVVLGREGEEEVLQPDVLFIAQERASVVQNDVIRGAPDLVVEVLSPSTAARDRAVKRVLYLRYGVREFWIVDPESRTIEVFLFREGRFVSQGVLGEGGTVSSSVLAGLRIPVSEIFGQ